MVTEANIPTLQWKATWSKTRNRNDYMRKYRERLRKKGIVKIATEPWSLSKYVESYTLWAGDNLCQGKAVHIPWLGVLKGVRRKDGTMVIVLKPDPLIARGIAAITDPNAFTEIVK